MENKEKKINAVELNDEKLENVSGGAVEMITMCRKCGLWFNVENLEEINGKMYCESCARTL